MPRKEVVNLSFTDRIKVAVKGQFVYNYNSNPINPLFGPRLQPDQSGIGSYVTYSDQVQATYRKYQGEERFGSTFVKSIVDFRTSYIAGNGAVIKAHTEGSAEDEWCKSFLKINKLDGSYFTTIVRYSELEGRDLLILNPKTINGKTQVKVQHIPWDGKNYTPIVDEKNYENIEKITVGKEDIKPDRFVYIQTGGVKHRPEYTSNKIHLSITDLEHIDRCLNDWSEYNQLYGLGTPVFEMQNWADAEEVAMQVKAMNWRPGHTISIPGKLTFQTPDGTGQQSMYAEITTRVKKVSGITGMPPHFFGFTDLLANRATAESMIEQISIATTDERNAIQDGLIELVEKSVALYNKLNNASIDSSKITVQLPMASQEQIRMLLDVYVPLSNLGYMSKDTVRNMIPNTDPKEEAKKMLSESATKPTSNIIRETIGGNPT